MTVNIDDFLKEWKMLLRKLVDSIDEAGLKNTEADGYDSLTELESRIEGVGQLY